MHEDHNEFLSRYAKLIVGTGLNVQPGQRLIIRAVRSSPDLVYLVAREAYRVGALLVHVLWEEDGLDLIRVREAPADSLAQDIDWYSYANNTSAARGDALLSIYTPDAELFKDEEPARVAAWWNGRRRGLLPGLALQMSSAHQWLVCRVPTTAWADRVFPELAPGERELALWNSIFTACRVYEADPAAAWREHLDNLVRRRDYMMSRRYSALHFRSPETDLYIGLPQGYLWDGGQSFTQAGVPYVANMPTEEVFTLPDRTRTKGHATTTFPVSLKGVLIKKLTLTFQGGRVTGVSAQNGQEVLERLFETDEGASRLGEVALVPAGNPVARLGRLYFDGLYDENAASHIAVGRGYRFTLENGAQITAEEFAAAGGNESTIHEDMMIGGPSMDVDGVCPDGSSEAVMRAGEWVVRV